MEEVFELAHAAVRVLGALAASHVGSPSFQALSCHAVAQLLELVEECAGSAWLLEPSCGALAQTVCLPLCPPPPLSHCVSHRVSLSLHTVSPLPLSLSLSLCLWQALVELQRLLTLGVPRVASAGAGPPEWPFGFQAVVQKDLKAHTNRFNRELSF